MGKYYKGFNKNLECRDYQYEVGKTYTEDGAVICYKGFHACENPLDTFNYYAPSDSRYCEVELDSDIKKENSSSDTKVCAKEIKIGAEIGIKGIIAATINYVFSKTEQFKGINATTGNQAHAATTGNQAHAATTGNFAHAATTGIRAHAATTGDQAHAATTGNFAHAATTGDWAHAAVDGVDSIAFTAGVATKAKGALGSWLVAAEWVKDDSGWQIKDIHKSKVDGDNIKPNTWYTAKDGGLVEVSGDV